MKEFKGVSLVKKKDKPLYGLVFWSGEEPHQTVEYDTEKERDETFNEVIQGKGIKVKYDFGLSETTVYPREIIKFRTEGVYGIEDSILRSIFILNENGLTKEFDFEKRDKQLL